MKALSLWQPWASLVAIGAKGIETRSWATGYRGPLAIHAAKNFPKWARELCGEIPFSEVLFGPMGYTSNFDLPLGSVVATCNLVECCAIKEDGLYRLDPDKIEHPVWFAPLPAEPELSFGDYTPGRFAWILKDVQKLPEPILVKGHQGLWNWEPPERG